MRRLDGVGAVGAMSVAAFCYVAMEVLPVGLLPLISADLDLPLSTVGLLVTGYGLTVAVMSVPLAHLTRDIPRRRLMSVLLAVFVVATAASAAAPSYLVLLGARVTVALSQAVFWAVVAPTAAGMFPQHVRGRVTSVVFAGASLGPMLGVPAGTWLGQQAGWRASFAALAGLGLIAFLLLVTLMPDVAPGRGHAATGTSPDLRRYVLVVLTTILAVGGVFTAFTYTSPFLTGVAGFPAVAVGPLLLLRGIADFGGISVAGLSVDRHPRASAIGATAISAAALFGLFVTGATPVAAAAFVALVGFAMGALTPALTNLVLEVAPGNADLASAGNSAAYNVGIAGGALLGGVVADAAGVRETALAGGLVVLAALAAIVADAVVSGRTTAPDRAVTPTGGRSAVQ